MNIGICKTSVTGVMFLQIIVNTLKKVVSKKCSAKYKNNVTLSFYEMLVVKSSEKEVPHIILKGMEINAIIIEV